MNEQVASYQANVALIMIYEYSNIGAKDLVCIGTGVI